MKDDAHPSKRYGGQGNVHKLLTPEMRQQVVQLKEKLEDYVGQLDTVCRNNVINNAIYRAYEIAKRRWPIGPSIVDKDVEWLLRGDSCFHRFHVPHVKC